MKILRIISKDKHLILINLRHPLRGINSIVAILSYKLKLSRPLGKPIADEGRFRVSQIDEGTIINEIQEVPWNNEVNINIAHESHISACSKEYREEL